MDYTTHLNIVTDAVNLLGYERICPESLMALSDAINADEVSADVCRSMRIVMNGFRALLAPVEAA